MSTKKEQIFQALITHIKTEGLLKGLTIAEIAELAEVGKGTVYEYFQSKDEVLAETFIYILEKSMEQIIIPIEGKAEFQTTLKNHIKTVMLISQEYSNIDTILMMDDLGSMLDSKNKQKLVTKILEIKKRYTEYLQEIIKLGVASQVIKETADPYSLYLISNIILSSITYFYQELPKNARDEKDHIEKTYNLILKLLA